MFRVECFIEVNVVRHLVHEREEEGDEETVPNMQMDIFILFGLEERDGMDLYFAKRGAVKFVEQAVKSVVEIFGIQPREELRDLLLSDGRS